MAGNSQRRGAMRKTGTKKGAVIGSGGRARRALEGRGPTPPAEMRKGDPAASLTLVKILAASQQVVAGMNYRMDLKVKAGGVEREAEAIVWWQAWNRQTPYRLTSWAWKSEK